MSGTTPPGCVLALAFYLAQERRWRAALRAGTKLTVMK
jgi:hypothetical protein